MFLEKFGKLKKICYNFSKPENQKTSIFKRMNCFKPQNSEENPLILLNKANSQSQAAMNNSKSLNSLKINEIITQEQQEQELKQQEQIQQLRLEKQQQMHEQFERAHDLAYASSDTNERNRIAEFYLNQNVNSQTLNDLRQNNPNYSNVNHVNERYSNVNKHFHFSN